MPACHTLTRDEVLESLAELADDHSFGPLRDYYLGHAVNSLDLELAGGMLGMGANPNHCDGGYDSFLHHLFERFRSQRTTHGIAVLSMVQLLLRHGADPNLVGCNNYRAVDLALMSECHEFSGPLIAAGADPHLRPFI